MQIQCKQLLVQVKFKFCFFGDFSRNFSWIFPNIFEYQDAEPADSIRTHCVHTYEQKLDQNKWTKCIYIYIYIHIYMYCYQCKSNACNCRSNSCSCVQSYPWKETNLISHKLQVNLFLFVWFTFMNQFILCNWYSISFLNQVKYEVPTHIVVIKTLYTSTNNMFKSWLWQLSWTITILCLNLLYFLIYTCRK